ncbi:MAG: hydrogenase maturation protease [bacterium]
MKILVLGLGNDLLSDDGIGITAARRLKKENLAMIDIIESNLTGVALMDIFEGYNKAVIIDAVFTKKYRPGTIIELIPEDFSAVESPSPHYTGIAEMIKIAEQLDIVFPDEIRIIAIEVSDPFTISDKLTKPVTNIIDDLLKHLKSQLFHWQADIYSSCN